MMLHGEDRLLGEGGGEVQASGEDLGSVQGGAGAGVVQRMKG